jgi:hypothetical protein
MTEEIRFALDPWRALVFTWVNDIDVPRPVLADDDLAADLNRGVIAQADREWFHHPSRRATRLKRNDLDVSACNSPGQALFPEYSSSYAAESPRRRHVAKLLSNMVEGRINNAFHVARVRRVPAGPS